MRTRKEIIEYCMTLKGSYEDYPFHDTNWTVMRHKSNKKSYAYIYERTGLIWVNVKCDIEWIVFWRNAFASVVPAYHMNKKHWNSVILDGTVPEIEVKRMIAESHDLTKDTHEKKEG